MLDIVPVPLTRSLYRTAVASVVRSCTEFADVVVIESIPTHPLEVPVVTSQASKTTFTECVPLRLAVLTLISKVYRLRKLVGVVTVFQIELSRRPMVRIFASVLVKVSRR